MMKYLIPLLLLTCGLSAQTKWRQIERSAVKWNVPAAYDSIPGQTGYASRYIDLQTLMDTVGVSSFAIDSLDYRNDSLLIWVGGGYYFAIITQGVSGSGDDGEVAYWMQDTLAGDTVHFWDATNKRLGLNTKTPGALLHVKKNEYALPVAEFDNPGTNGQTVLIKHGASSDGRYPLKIQTPASTTYFDARGYLGLGITPSYPLHVYNSSGISRFENSGANGDAGFDLKNGNKNYRVAMNADGGSSNDLHFRDVTGSRYPLTLKSSNGYVGVLNLSPARELHVTGRVRVSTLDTDLTAPTTAGTTKMVITDEDGDLSFAAIPGGGSIDSTNIIGGWGIESTESPANTFNLIADSTQVASQYDLTLKQDKLTLTTTGTSGAATLVGATLNVPQYQSVLTNPVTGTGTTNRVSKFTGTSTIGNSQLYDDGSTVGVGALNSSYKFYINSGNMKLGDNSISGSLNKLYFGDGTFVYVGEDVADDRLYLKGGSLSVNIGGSLGGNGQVLTSNGTTATWATPASGSGTVTSVQLAAGTGISLTGTNPITTSGTITVTNSAPNVTTNLSYTGTASPITLNSSDGTDVTFTAGTGITLSGTSSNMTITASGGGGTTNLSYGALNTGGVSTYGDYILVDNSSGSDVYLHDGDGIDILRSSSNYAGYKLNQTWGYLSWSSSASISIGTSPVKVDFGNSTSNGSVTPSTTSDNFTINATGTYEIHYSISTNGTSNRGVTFEIYKNNAASFGTMQQSVNNDIQSVSYTGIQSLNINDVIDLRVNYSTATGSGTNINYNYPTFTIKRIK